MKLPEPDTHCHDYDSGLDCWSYSEELMREMYLQGLEDAADVCKAHGGVYGRNDKCIEAIRALKEKTE